MVGVNFSIKYLIKEVLPKANCWDSHRLSGWLGLEIVKWEGQKV